MAVNHSYPKDFSALKKQLDIVQGHVEAAAQEDAAANLVAARSALTEFIGSAAAASQVSSQCAAIQSHLNDPQNIENGAAVGHAMLESLLGNQYVQIQHHGLIDWMSENDMGGSYPQDKPLAGIVNTSARGSHWVSWVLLPANYTPPSFSSPTTGDKPCLFLFDSYQGKIAQQLPDGFVAKLRAMPHLNELEVVKPDNEHFQQPDTHYCLYWSIYNILRTVLDGNDDFFRQAPTISQYRRQESSMMFRSASASSSQNLADACLIGGFLSFVLGFLILFSVKSAALHQLWLGSGNFFLGDFALVFAFASVWLLLASTPSFTVDNQRPEPATNKLHRQYLKQAGMLGLGVSLGMFVAACLAQKFAVGMSLGLEGLIYASASALLMMVVWQVTKAWARQAVSPKPSTPSKLSTPPASQRPAMPGAPVSFPDLSVKSQPDSLVPPTASTASA